MIPLRALLIGLFSGILIGLSWLVFIDGQLASHDKLQGTHIVPCIFATLLAVCLNLVSIEQVSKSNWVKAWVFACVTGLVLCIGASIFILDTEYPPDASYPGIAIMLQTILSFLAAFLFFVGRKPIGQDSDF